jgi:hypothetical protein
MFKVIVEVTRPDPTFPFYVLSRLFFENEEVMGMLRGSQGFIDHTYQVSEDDLVFTRTTSWENENSYFNFLYQWLEARPDYVIDYSNYNSDHGHILVTRYETQ